MFSTYLYTGTGANQTITNGIDLATKGGLVWQKCRSTTKYHVLTDTVRGAGYGLYSNTTDAQDYAANRVPAFNTNGFDTGANSEINSSGATFVSWTFRKQPKFFDVVTYTGNETAGKTVNHSLGSDPGCIIIKRISPSGYNWFVYHRSNPTKYTNLNLTNAETNFTIVTSVSSTNFTLPADASTNANGIDYVAYLFAHNAGGFGLTGTDNVISCGSYSGTGATGNAITLGYEPQFVIVKRTDTTADWITMDAMRGGYLKPNTSDAELGGSGWFNVGGDNFFPTATGFQVNTTGAAWNASGGTYIYIAIRRGPMKVPTSGTSVFSPNAVNNASNTQNTTNFRIDLQLSKWRGGVLGTYWLDRLRGLSSKPSSQSIITGPYLQSSSTNAEVVGDDLGYLYDNTSWRTGLNLSSVDMAYWNFQRAPSFFDEVCFTQSDYTQAYTHNLTVVPEMMIVKRRNNTSDWSVYSAALGNTKYLKLQDTGGEFTGGVWGNTSPTSTQFTFSGAGSPNTYVAYLFATCAGVSKVGSYTGTGTTKQIDCGFTGGARFVLIKRTDSTGDWYVWDSARGIVAGNDPYLLLNSTAAEVTNTDYVDTYSAGFEISSTAPAAINASGGTFIFLAIA